MHREINKRNKQMYQKINDQKKKNTIKWND